MRADIDLTNMEEKIGRLMEMLKLAHEMYFSEDPGRDRIAARTALAGCINFAISVVRNDIDLVLPLRDLNYALHDLDNGRTAGMLKRAAKTGGRRMPVSIEAFRATVAALMELYLKTGLSRDRAAEVTAEWLVELGYRGDRNRPITAGQVEDWRDKVSEGGDSLGVKRFKGTLEMANKICHGDPDKAIGLVLDSLSAIRRPDVPRVRQLPDSK